MDLNRAATFVRVVEAGSFTAAAGALHVPTSSVSRSVSKLEHELGVTLLERTTRKLSLTDAGRAYFERARDAVAGLDEAGALAVDAAREPQGLVRIAAPPEMGGHPSSPSTSPSRRAAPSWSARRSTSRSWSASSRTRRSS
jgi:DNA-binding transcriptional LysR family regulator